MRLWLFCAGVSGMIAVGAGAYGWHWLETSQSGHRDIFNLGVQYQMWHALALLGVAWLADRGGGRVATLAGWAFLLGTVLFSGTLYIFAVTEVVPLRGAAPIGGGLLMLGWLAFAWAAVRRRPE